MADNNSFLGTGMKFPPAVDKATGRFMTVSDEESVRESIYLILMTQTSERLTRPNFGSEIMSYTFMDTTATMLSIMRRNLTEAIISQEPRVSDVDITTDLQEGQGMIIVNIDYVVTATNTEGNLVFPFYLDTGSASEPDLENEPQYFNPEEEVKLYDSKETV